MIYALASEPHYRAHLEDVAAGLEAEWVEKPPFPDGLYLVAGYKDLRRLPGKRVVLFEHGAGQSYGTVHGAYAGGAGRGSVEMFICPNEQSALRNRRRYPQIPTEVVGSPRVERLRKLPFEPDGSIALTWHWNADMVAPEAHWAFPHYRSVLREIAGRFKVIGHSHPRIARFMAQQYEAAGIEYVPDFDEVCRRASVLVADNTSAMFEFAALDRPVVVANSPWYRKDVDLGGRFWDWADVGIQVDDPLDLADAITLASRDDEEIATRRRKIVKEVYPYKAATSRAIAAVRKIAGTNHQVGIGAETVAEVGTGGGR